MKETLLIWPATHTGTLVQPVVVSDGGVVQLSDQVFIITLDNHGENEGFAYPCRFVRPLVR